MAKNYEALREVLQAAGEERLQKLNDIFQEHKSWLLQAVSGLKVEVAGSRQLRNTRGRSSLKVPSQKDLPVFKFTGKASPAM